MATKKKKAPARRKAAAPKRRKHRRQPETLRLRDVSPGFTVKDMTRSLAFYRDVLGFTVSDLWKDGDTLLGAELKAGTARFWIGQDDWAKGRDRVKGEGFRIYCTTTQDVDALAEQVKARGGKLLHGPATQPWGVRDFGVVDPDGFKITIQRRSKT